MASDLERLIVSLEARTTQFNNALNKSNQIAKKQLGDIQKKFAETNKKLSEGIKFGGFSVGGINDLKAGAAGFAGAFAVDKIKDYADAWTEAGNKIAASSVVSGRSARSLDDLNKIATDTRSGLTETVDLYAKLLRATTGVAKSEQEVATATEVVNKAFKAGGAEASEQAAGILQLSQALSSGIVQGDELRSIRENAPLIAQAIASEFKTTIGGLKQLGADGKLTVDRVFKAILDAKPLIDKAFDSTQATIGDNLGLVNNALTAFVGKLSDVTGAGGAVKQFLGHDLVDAVNSISTGLENVKNSGAIEFLGHIVDGLNKINELSQSIGKASAGGGIVPNLAKAMSGDGIAKQFNDAGKDIEQLFDRLQRAADAGVISKEQADAFANLRKQLRDGTIDADGAAKAIHSIADGTPALADLAGKFDAIVVRVRALTAEAEKAAAATAKIASDKTLADLGAGEDADKAASRKFQAESKAYGDFVGKQLADSNRSDLQKDIDERADKIKAAADQIGVAMTAAAAKILAAKELANEEIAKSASQSVNGAVGLIKDFEGFVSTAKWDRNAFRAGYGSDTVTLADGTIQKITEGMSVSVADANRDLVRRIGEFQDGIKKQIGADTFNSFDDKQQSALLSIAYNYGSLPDRIVAAIKTGNQEAIVKAIRGLGADNGGINKERRNSEADLFLSGAPSGVQKAVKADDRFGKNLTETQAQIDLLNKEAQALGLVNPLVNDYGYAQSKAEIKQKLLNDAMQNGVEITPEYAAKIDDLAEKYATADAARNKMQQGVENLSAKMAASSELGKSVLGGFLQDLRDGKTGAEAFSNALGKVADKLAEIALNNLFDGGTFGATPGSALLGTLFVLGATNDNFQHARSAA
ncbi:tape measure protein [Mesorhizobium sp. GbtcB19]|uniref:tape measure protein n=1 Tax=Mesorhizobium sp. GbtcB19 TaxID=2824764 RepID=UPI001C30DCD1|nr:tape measure protein [Mesorhizobium sp. GbtcB19]